MRQGHSDGLFGGGGAVDSGAHFFVGDLPGVQADDGYAEPEGESDFGEGAVRAMNSNDRVAGSDQQ